MAALIGSPSHLSITVSDGISGPISTALGIQTKHNLSNRQEHNYFSMPKVYSRLCFTVCSLTKTDPLVVVTKGSE